jgi:hypothetical protein
MGIDSVIGKENNVLPKAPHLISGPRICPLIERDLILLGSLQNASKG